MWRGAEAAAGAAFVVALLVAAGALLAGGGVHRFFGIGAFGAELHPSVRYQANGSAGMTDTSWLRARVFQIHPGPAAA